MVVTEIKQRSFNRPLILQPADPLTRYRWHWASSFRFEINTLKLTVVNFWRLSITISKSKVPRPFATFLNIRERSFSEESTRGGGAKKIVVGGLKGSEGETGIWIEGEVLLGGESSQKL